MFSILVSVQFGHCRLNPWNVLKLVWSQIGASVFNSRHVMASFIVNKRTDKKPDVSLLNLIICNPESK